MMVLIMTLKSKKEEEEDDVNQTGKRKAPNSGQTRGKARKLR